MQSILLVEQRFCKRIHFKFLTVIIMSVKFDRLGVMLDCSRNAVMGVEQIKRYIEILSNMGYNTLMLYTEDTYEINEQPYFGYLRGKYSKDELKDIDRYALSKGIELIPCIQTLAHLNQIFRWSSFSNAHDCNDILLVGADETYKFIDDMLKTVSEVFTSKIVHIGMDEAHMLGRGKYTDKFGYSTKSEILISHLDKVSKMAADYGLQPLIWGDMFFRSASPDGRYSTQADGPKIIENAPQKVPANVEIVYWDYYSSDKAHYDTYIKKHNEIKENTWFAGGIWTWSGFAPHNKYSISNTRAALDACEENNVNNVVFTLWGDNGAECSRYSALPALYFASEYAKGNTDLESIKLGFEKNFGIAFDDFLLCDLTQTPNTLAGSNCNPEKYLLYNDVFLGMFDTSLSGEEGKMYGSCAEKLKKLSEHKEYGYVFKTLEKLCRALEIKCDLGIRARRAYKEKDQTLLNCVITDHGHLINRLEELYDALEKQWMCENRPHGFEVQDIRLGGLIRRIKHCKERLEDYATGKTDVIPELEEVLLPYDNQKKPAYINYNSWSGTVTANII